MSTSQFYFDAETTALIDRLRASSRSGSRVDTMRKALCLLHIATTAKDNHQKIFVVSNDGAPDVEIVV